MCFYFFLVQYIWGENLNSHDTLIGDMCFSQLYYAHVNINANVFV